MAVRRRVGVCCPYTSDPVTNHPIQGSVGLRGRNASKDVVIIQQMLNALSPLEGGPTPKLAEDGKFGLKTLAAISTYQKHALGWSDGRVDVNGPTIKTLTSYIVLSPTVPFGKLGLPASASQTACSSTPTPSSSSLGANSIAVAHMCMRVMEPRLRNLRWKLTRTTPAMMGLLSKHFATSKEKLTSKDVGTVQKVLGGIHHYISRFNAFGKLPVENVILFDPAPPGNVIAHTVRGGDKMSTKQVQIYEDKGKVSKHPGQSIWLTSLFADQPSHEKHWTILHEFCHFVGPRDGFFTAINDNAYAGEKKFLEISKFSRLHNAESLSLFFLECCIGTDGIARLPRLSTHKAHFNVFPKVDATGDVVTS